MSSLINSIIDFKPSDFELNNPQKLDKKYKGQITIVKFYSPTCMHCINSQPEYINLASQLQNDKKYNIAQFDCTVPENRELIGKLNDFTYGYSVEGYPTYIIFIDTLYLKTYTGDRNANSILNVLQNIHALN